MLRLLCTILARVSALLVWDAWERAAAVCFASSWSKYHCGMGSVMGSGRWGCGRGIGCGTAVGGVDGDATSSNASCRFSLASNPISCSHAHSDSEVFRELGITMQCPLALCFNTPLIPQLSIYGAGSYIPQESPFCPVNNWVCLLLTESAYVFPPPPL
jgi:hypothetical protein